jgi:adenylate cyclase
MRPSRWQFRPAKSLGRGVFHPLTGMPLRWNLYGHMEIERKFLVKSPPAEWRHVAKSRIDQGYFPTASDELEIRLRRKDASHFLTIKSGRGRVRVEEEIPIPRKRFAALWPLTRGSRISKDRYRIPCGKRTIELDVYRPPNRGLRTADIEFTSKRDSTRFHPPHWLGREITGNERYANRRLAARPRRS